VLKDKHPKKTTTVRVTIEARDFCRDFATVKGVKMLPMLSNGLINAIKKHPELFLPSHMH
jgi:hypothetical protein